MVVDHIDVDGHAAPLDIEARIALVAASMIVDGDDPLRLGHRAREVLGASTAAPLEVAVGASRGLDDCADAVDDTVARVENHGLLIDFRPGNCTPRRCMNRVAL